jgi:hypothetical protein
MMMMVEDVGKRIKEIRAALKGGELPIFSPSVHTFSSLP